MEILMLELKFVLLKDGTLFIGSAGSYHREICQNVPKDMVQAAGYLHEDGDGKVGCHGNSYGYSISHNAQDREIISNILDKHNCNDFSELYKSTQDTTSFLVMS